MKRMAVALMLIALAAGCGRQGESNPPAATGNAHPAVAVETAVAATGTVTQGIEVTGTLAPKFEVDVKSEVVGLVREVFVTEWVPVEKGAPLARIDVQEQEALVKRTGAALELAKAGLLEAQVAQNRADRELARAKKLREAGLATQQALEDSQTAAEAAASRIEAARAQVAAAGEDLSQVRTRLSKGLILAPMAGIVSERKVNVGDLVGEAGANQPLFHIVDNRILNLTVTVPSVSMAGLRRSQAISFTTDALPGRTFQGKVTFINPAVSETDRSVRVIAEVNNAAGELKGGLFVKGRIVTGSRREVLLVPREALTGWDATAKKARIFVVEAGLARGRDVGTGSATDEGVEIRSGLKPGEACIVRGAFNVKEGDHLNVVSGAGGAKP